jgi:hypothetical protein
LQQLGQAAAHGLDVGRQLGRLRDHRAVDVDRPPAGLPHRRQRARQQHHGIGAGELGGGVGEMAADVAQAGGAEQRVGDGVRQRVGIRMAQQAVAVRDAHAAEDQRAAFDERCTSQPSPMRRSMFMGGSSAGPRRARSPRAA